MVVVLRCTVIVVMVVMVMGKAQAVGILVGQFQIAHHHLAGTSADRAHHTTSMSLIRISSPASGISRPPPHSGQGSSRSFSSTLSPQS
jgi:hypothetical protein